MMGAERGELKAAFYGTCSEPWLTVVRAELKAVEEAVRRAVAPLTIYTDSAAVVRAFRKGKAYACRATNDGADIWRRIWATLQDFGDFEILKVKAHTTAEDSAEGLIDPLLQAGNAAADHFAVAARRIAAQRAPCDSFDTHYARARAWYKHILAEIGEWRIDVFGDAEEELGDTVAQEEQQDHEEEEGETTGGDAGSVRRHILWTCKGHLHCSSCGLSFGPAANPAAIARRKCRGPLQQRVFSSLGMRQALEVRHAYSTEEMHAAGAELWRGGASPMAAAAASGTTEPASGAVRRRLIGKQPRPTAYKEEGITDTTREVESGHILVTRGRFTFCDRCGRWAINRLSIGLQRKCTGTVDTAVGAYRVRRDRLRQGRHPLTNRLIQ